MKILKVLGGIVAVVLVVVAGGLAWLLYRLNTYDPAWGSVDGTAAVVARNVDLAVADLSPGQYPTVGFGALTSAIGNYGGTVRDSRVGDYDDLSDLHSWADAEFLGGADGQKDVAVCVRFELRWNDVERSTTYHRIDCS
ncbi:hypothetical protein [Actinoplanes sp. HUAS TT8]|uniref:hypothetical protein n=1 Tax=Actinoplanes sp. HUAS TT8 TaxID=3447453 RepID=UPI003F51F53A